MEYPLRVGETVWVTVDLATQEAPGERVVRVSP
jgi:hypothetical protein